MNFLHKELVSFEDNEVEFIFIKDTDLRVLIKGNYQDYTAEHKEKDVVVVFVGYPSYNSVVLGDVNFPLSLVRSLYP